MRLDRPLTALKSVKSPVSTACLAGRKTVLSASIPAASIWKCVGNRPGRGFIKWGLRHFRCLQDNVELLPSGNNAIGGLRPFFTPENGLINPPEHTLVDIEILEEGPVYHHYRMHGDPRWVISGAAR